MNEAESASPIAAEGGLRTASPTEARSANVLGVDYACFTTDDGSDLYLTQFGVSLRDHLLLENWYAHEWFEANSERLDGPSRVYRVPTRKIRNTSIELVVKWSRVGEPVPLDTLSVNRFDGVEFNSPFEEFSLLMELRAGKNRPPGVRIRTQKPLGIYVPSTRLKRWQTGRSDRIMAAKQARNQGVKLDTLRQYILLYGWIKGTDLTRAAGLWQVELEERRQFLARVTSMVAHELEGVGFRLSDMQPENIIVRQKPDGAPVLQRNGKIAYAVVDYEMLERIPTHD